MVDANFPSGARLALEDAKKASSKPVKYVFDTHHHGDHAYRNPIWTKQGAVTLAYVGVAEEMKRYLLIPKPITYIGPGNLTGSSAGGSDGTQVYSTLLYQ